MNNILSKPFLSLIIFFFLSLTMYGQRTITGKVTDADTGEGVIGANVVVKGTTIGTVTDFDGSYTITLPPGADTLTFSYTGYNTVSVATNTGNVLNVAIGEGKILDEVVLIGYGTVKREDATGSVQSVSAESFNKGAITGPQELLAGKVAGVVINTGGAPGEGAAIRIRGESSLSASNDPLIVVDGVPLEGGSVNGGRNALNFINPNDIETFTILKDASATAIYGNRASAGVILITTKKGTVGGKLKVGYSGNVSIGQVTDYIDVLDADEFRFWVDSLYAPGHGIHALIDTFDTDWQKEIYQTAIGHDHNLYFSGGVGIVPYRVSLGYTDKDGILKTDEFRRVSAGFNLTPGFFDNTLQLNLNFKSMFAHNQFADRGAIGNALNFDPTHAVRDSDPENPYGGFTTWELNGGLVPNTISPTNPVALLELKDDVSNENRYLLGLSADYRIPFLPDLRANINLAYDYHKGDGEVKIDTTAAFAFDAEFGGGAYNTYDQIKENRLLEFYLNYKKVFDKHALDLMGGYSWQHFERDSRFRNSDVAGTPSKTTFDTLSPSELYLLSFFGRANYAFNDRYLLTLSLRRDGTSRFAPENRWGLFPAAAVAIKLIDNDNVNFNNLKLRVGWGITGQERLDDDYYVYLARYERSNERAKYQFGNDYHFTYRANEYDANIKWEETETYNVGVDFSIIRDRLSGSLDGYKRLTSDLLNRIPVPAGTNLSNFVTTNVGDMENYGVEATIFATPVKTASVTWDVGANVAFNKNEITKLLVTDDPEYEGVLVGGISGGVGSNIQIHTVGYAPYSFYVYEQVYDENGKIVEGEFVDRNQDGVINIDDKYRFEDRSADMTFGFTSLLEIGDFDFSFAGRASAGNYVYNNVQTDRGYLDRLYLSTGGPSLWNVTQSAVDLDIESQASMTFSDHFVKRADFVKLDHITFGYNFREVIGQFLRLSLTVQNVLTLTNYDGLDPEIFSGIDQNIYPRPRNIVFGLNVEF